MSTLYDAIVEELRFRGAEPQAPAVASMLTKLESMVRKPFGDDFRKFYAAMDGFAVPDPGSQLQIWGVERIIEFYGKIDVDSSWLIIGDFLIESDFVVAFFAEEKAEVKFLNENRLLTNSIYELVENIVSGTYEL